MFIHATKPTITLLLMIAVGFTTASIDIYIASLPYMVEYFNSTQEMLQFTISAGIIGTSISTLFIGPLSDAIGRRNLMVWGQALYGVFSILAAFSPTVEFLILCRFLAGAVACATFVLAFAVISDMYSRDEAPIHFANITTSILIALIIAPFIGGYFADMQRWDYSFLFLGVGACISSISLWLYLPETLQQRKKFSVTEAAKTYGKILSNSQFLGLAIIPSLLITGILSFFANGSFYYIEELGLSEWEYSKHQILIMGSNCAFSFLAGRLIKKSGLIATANIGMVCVMIGGISFLMATYFYPSTPLLMTLTIALYASGSGFCFSSVTSMAMQEFPESPGITSALLALVRGVIISLGIVISGLVYIDQAIEIALTIIVISLVAMGIYAAVLQLKKQTLAKLA